MPKIMLNDVEYAGGGGGPGGGTGNVSSAEVQTLKFLSKEELDKIPTPRPKNIAYFVMG